MRSTLLLAAILVLSACSSTESDAALVFASAFSQPQPSDVVVLNGYSLERRKFFKVSGRMWRLHLAGPGARRFVRERWPDLRLGNPRVFLQGTQTPWFAPGRDVKYFTYMSPSDAAVTVMERDGSDEVFIAYDDTR